MRIFATAFVGGFLGKAFAAFFIAVCVVMGFGPEEWAGYVVSGLGEWATPELARWAFLALALVTFLLVFLPWIIGVIGAARASNSTELVPTEGNLGPKISARFEETDEFRKRVTLRSTDLTRQWSGISIRGIAETDSDYPITDCSAYVTKIELQNEDGSFSRIPPYERLKLKWALERDEFAPVAISKDVPAHFGIVQAQERLRYFLIPTQTRSHSHPAEFRKHGTYRITVAVICPTAHRQLWHC